jgi:ribosomal protein L29
VQIPSSEEVHEKPRVRTSSGLQSLQNELFELRAQLEGLQLELPDVNQGNGADHG